MTYKTIILLIISYFCFIPTYCQSYKNRAIGDINNDGYVNISDVSALVNQILGKEEFEVIKQLIEDNERENEYQYAPSLNASYYSKDKYGFEDFVIANDTLFSVSKSGVQKVQFINNIPKLIGYNSIVAEILSETRFRSITKNNDLLYISTRQNTAGKEELYKPLTRITFEQDNIYCNYTNLISNNLIINSFFKKLQLSTIDPNSLKSIYILKAYNKNGGYRNSILISNGNDQTFSFVGETFATEKEALENLKEKYVYSNAGIESTCIVDWNAITDSYNYCKNFTLYNTGDFDFYEKTDDIKIISSDYHCPNTGNKSCAFVINNSNSNQHAILAKEIEFGSSASISFWINISEESEGSCIVPIFLNESKNSIVKLQIATSPNSFKISLESSSNQHNNAIVLNKNTWYNFKLNITGNNASLYYRTKECSNWNIIYNDVNLENEKISYLACGLITESKNFNLFVDDIYYDSRDIDYTSYVNGKLYVLDSKDLTIRNQYNLNLKGTDIYTYKNLLIMNFLCGFNIYDISDAESPNLLFSHRENSYVEYQGGDIYEIGGKIYIVECNYTKGISVWDITNPIETKKVGMCSFNDFLCDNINVNNQCYTFDVKVDYPFAYVTCGTFEYNLGTEFDKRGLLVMDLSNLDSIDTYFFPIPKEDLFESKLDGDKHPIRIEKIDNYIFLNNSEKGIVCFDISNPLKAKYIGKIVMPETGRVSAICKDDKNYLYIGEGQGRHIYKYDILKK